MTELARQVQVLLLTAATTMHVWRDVAVAILALAAIGLLLLYADQVGRP